MRSIVVASVVSCFVFASLVGCSSGTNGTGRSQSAGTADPADGGVKKKSPFGGSIVGKNPQKDAGVMPDPAPGLVPTCKGAALCIDACPDDPDAETCWAACMKDMPAEEYAELEAVGVCINESGCETEACIQQACAAEIDACIE